ncbi:MAG: VTT domain-containing protein [Nanoarchaeota archaeon]
MKKNINHSKVHKEALKISRKELLKNIFWICAILVIIYLSAKVIGTENIQDKVENAGIFGPLIFIILKAATIVFAPLSGTPLYLIAGTLFGFGKGVLYTMLGDFIGFSISFYISRIFGRKVAGYFLSGSDMGSVQTVVSHMGTTKGLVQSCLVFIGMPEVVSYGAGLTRILYSKFAFTIVLVEIIPVTILVWLGEAIVKSTSALLIVNVLIFLVIFFGIFWLHSQAKKNRKKHKLF